MFCPYQTTFNGDFGRPSFSNYQRLTQFLPFLMASSADLHNTLLSIASKPVQRTANTHRPTMKDMSVDHRRFDVTMTQQILNRSNVIPAFEQVGDERIGKTRDS